MGTTLIAFEPSSCSSACPICHSPNCRRVRTINCRRCRKLGFRWEPPHCSLAIPSLSDSLFLAAVGLAALGVAYASEWPSHVQATESDCLPRLLAAAIWSRKLEMKHRMFLDLSVLVDAQGDMLNDIEAQVSKAEDHVQSGTTMLQIAKKTQRNTRKYMCFTILILIIILILVLIPLLRGVWGKQGT